MERDAIAQILRPFDINPSSYQILRKLYYGSQPKDTTELCDLRRKRLLYLSDSDCKLELSRAGIAVYECATLAIEDYEREKVEKLDCRGHVFTIAQLVAMALMLIAISLSGFFKKTLDASTYSVNTIYAPHRNGSAILAKGNHHEQQNHTDSSGGAKGAPRSTEGRGFEHL